MRTMMINNYESKRSKVIGMSDAGYSDSYISNVLGIPLWKVIDMVQIEYGRRKLYEERKRMRSR